VNVAFWNKTDPVMNGLRHEKGTIEYADSVRSIREAHSKLFDDYYGNILDIGCGGGACKEALLAEGYNYVGYDIAEDTARTVSSLDDVGSDFDLIVCAHVLHHMNSVDSLVEMLKLIGKHAGSADILLNMMGSRGDGLRVRTGEDGFPKAHVDPVLQEIILRGLGFEVVGKYKPSDSPYTWWGLYKK